MGEVLFLSHRIPFPPDRGDKIRSHHILKSIAKWRPVHVATFADDHEDWLYEDDLAKLSKSYKMVHRIKPLAVAGLEALLRQKALSLTAFHDPRLQRYIRQVLSQNPIDTIYVFSGQMAQYVPKDFQGRIITDFVDVDSLKFEAYSKQSKGFRAWIEAREARLLQMEEVRVHERSNVSLLISDKEADLFRSRLPSGGDQVQVMGNGLDADYFDLKKVSPEPQLHAFPTPRIIFTGQMDYAPNLSAVFRTIHNILPVIRGTYPSASFHVVGRNPPPSLLDYSGIKGVYVWGRVQDIRPWLAAADIALVALDIARGIQNKVLESMAMSVPVVLTNGAAQGIAAIDGKEFCIGQDDQALIRSLLNLAEDQAKRNVMGVSAREWILRYASWSSALDKLPEYLGLVERAS